MANAIYNNFKGQIGNGSIDWDNDVIKIALVTSAYTPDIDAHTDFATHITGEVVGTGYTAGGATLAGNAVTVDNALDLAKYSANSITWTASTITARGAVVYHSVSGDLICYVDFVSDQSSTAGDFTINWHTNGIFTLA